jgi:hypothetical protein
MPLGAKIVFTVFIVLWTTFLCTIGRWSMVWLYNRRGGGLFAKLVFRDGGEIRPIGVIIFFGLMLVEIWLGL